MKVVTDGKHRWTGKGKIKTGKGIVDPSEPPEWAKVFDAKFLDSLDKLRRGPQVVNRKDVGLILSLTGLGRGWRVVEGGSGSGFLACWLAHLGCEVTSYEKREDFHEIARANAETLDLPIEFKKGSVFELTEDEVDLIIFDVPNPWEGADRAQEALVEGGYFISYLPTTNQVHNWLRATRDLADRRVVTTTQLEWRVSEDAFRPKHKNLAHTAFVCLGRKL